LLNCGTQPICAVLSRCAADGHTIKIGCIRLFSIFIQQSLSALLIAHSLERLYTLLRSLDAAEGEYWWRISANKDGVLSCRYERIDAQAAAFMKGNEDRFPLDTAEKDRILQHLDKFSKSAKMRDAALALYVNAKVSLVSVFCCTDIYHHSLS